MTIQEQLSWSEVDDASLSFLAAIGADYLAIYPTPEELSDGKNRLADWVRLLEEGQVDMAEAMRHYRAVGFEGPFMMDHTPKFVQPGTELCGRAFAA